MTKHSETNLGSYDLAMWRAWRSQGRKRYSYTKGRDIPAAVFDVIGDFRHTLRQWQFLGLATGKGSKAQRRIDAINRANGPWLNWPEMTITAN